MPTKDETIDIYDHRMIHMGTMSREKAHRLGHWHKTFQCWIIGRPRQIYSVLLQLRHKNKAVFPDKLDKSAAGHLTAGEKVADGLRELEEELGIKVHFDDLIECGIIPLETPMESGGIDREFCHVFLYRCDRTLHEFQIAEGEVSGLFWVALTDFYDLVYGHASQVRAEGFVIRDDGTRIEESRKIQADDLTPQSELYYERLFSAIKRQGWL